MFSIVVAVVAALVMLRVGLAVIRAIGHGLPEPPPPGELRKIKLQYRCSICGAELRMTRASEEEPEAPRHCMEEMELLASID